MTAAPRFAHFTATCANATNAAEFAAEAERTCGATDITRKGRVVEFDAVAIDDDGSVLIGDVHESARYYGGDSTKLTQTFTTPLKETPMTTTPTPAETTTTAPRKATPAKTPAAKATSAKATPKATPKAAAPTAKAAAPAAAAPVDLAALAAGVTEIKELPKAVKSTSSTSTNVFLPLVERSFKENKVLTTPPVADVKQALRVIDAVWRAADRLGVKVSCRRVPQDDGTIAVAFSATAKPAN